MSAKDWFVVAWFVVVLALSVWVVVQVVTLARTWRRIERDNRTHQEWRAASRP